MEWSNYRRLGLRRRQCRPLRPHWRACTNNWPDSWASPEWRSTRVRWFREWRDRCGSIGTASRPVGPAPKRRTWAPSPRLSPPRPARSSATYFQVDLSLANHNCSIISFHWIANYGFFNVIIIVLQLFNDLLCNH